MPAWALTTFLGAFLLFLVQPLMGKFILPWFGGAAGVWTTCMLFFQAMLLGGYAYAHFSTRLLKPRAQGVLHALLMVIALATLPIIPADSWKPRGTEEPTLSILLLLTACLGLPYFVVSSTAPLVQRWFSLTNRNASPYRLYALSNLGSLLALISYPVFFELNFTRSVQAEIWSWGFVAYVTACAFCVLKLWRANPVANSSIVLGASDPPASLNSQLSPINCLLWLLLPSCASALLLAVTNKLCQDVAVLPFLWVIPLAIYLLTFILSFDHPRWYARFPFTLALIGAVVALCWVLYQGTDAKLATQLTFYCGGLFVCCMVCHGELSRLKPDPRHLTAFYLCVAAGGMIGGLFVAVGAPLLFTDFLELHWALGCCGVLFAVTCLRSRSAFSENLWRVLGCLLTVAVFWGFDWALSWLGAQATPRTKFVPMRIAMWCLLVFSAAAWVTSGRFMRFSYWRLLCGVWMVFGLVGLGLVLRLQARESRRANIVASRSFYGVLAVREYEKDDPAEHYFLLRHGRITHGLQFAESPRAEEPTTYYGEKSGVGLAMNALTAGSRRVGLVGLGTGTLVAYGREGDYFRVYEINPDVPRLATTNFKYLNQSQGKFDIVLGDARLSMERESSQQFDLLVLDAFSSDAIPVHLLTREAFEIYGRHLRTNGIIAVHISNHYLDLEPVVLNAARHFGYGTTTIDFDETGETWWMYNSTWMLLTRRERLLDSPAVLAAQNPPRKQLPVIPLWTDDFMSVLPIIK